MGECVVKMTPLRGENEWVSEPVEEWGKWQMTDEGAGEIHLYQLLDGLFASRFRQVGIEAFQRGAEVADKHHVAIAAATQGAVGSKSLVIVGVNALPAVDIAQMIGKGLLDQPVFAVDVSDHAEFM